LNYLETGLSDQNANLLLEVFKKYDFIDEIILYGSRAKGNFTDRSDVDLVIVGKPKDRFDISKVINEIEETSFPYNIDLQLYSDIKNYQLLDHINRLGKTFYKRKN
jgi:predicted nucleotidyltransferase